MSMQEAILNIAVSGNIGCGKTTFLHRILSIMEEEYPNWLVQKDEDSEPLITVIEEDLVDWSYMLKKFYENPERFAFDFQFKVSLHYQKVYEIALRSFDSSKKDGLKRVILVERSPHDVLHVFIKTNKKNMTPKEYNALVSIHELICEKDMWTSCCNMVILNTPLEECWNRKKQRGRFEESEMTMMYMQLLDTKYKEMMNTIKEKIKEKNNTVNELIILDDNQDEKVRRIVNMMKNHISV